MDIKTKTSLFIIASLITTIARITSPSVFAKLTTSSNTTDVSMHITEAIKALRAGDIQGAKMHLAEAITSLQLGDISKIPSKTQILH
ncbi:MAG: hypothetical protein ACTHJ7_11270 [Candidatus Nitrosocosmicus sp.]